MIQERCLALTFQPAEMQHVLRNVRLLIGPGLTFGEVTGGDPTGGDEGYEWAIVGIDPFRTLSLCGIQVQQPVRLTLECVFAQELAGEQFVDAEVVESGWLPGHNEAAPVGGLTLRFEPPRPEIHLILGSEPFVDPAVREAILFAVPWRELSAGVLGQPDVPVRVSLWQEDLVVSDARQWPFDPDRAQVLLAEAGYDLGIPLALVVAAEDPALFHMAEVMAETLSRIGWTFEFHEVPADDAVAVLAQMSAAGQPAMLLLR
jgi:hypothetical protein